LEGKEQVSINGPQSPFAGLAEVIDRDKDGKIYLKELLEFATRQSEAARSRLVVTTADQGRAIFGILDLDRDRRLGAREVMRTVDRVTSWDSDGDGRVSADEIPYHFQVTIARGGLLGVTGEGAGAAAARSIVKAGPAVGPDWFQKMDRNHDGDVSRREFLGPRDQFDRLDRDQNGLIDPDEARSSVAGKNKDGARNGSQP
jgi:Ca2+-binding EF-hand superfamily protein